jgi:hypothetical protein
MNVQTLMKFETLPVEARPRIGQEPVGPWTVPIDNEGTGTD